MQYILPSVLLNQAFFLFPPSAHFQKFASKATFLPTSNGHLGNYQAYSYINKSIFMSIQLSEIINCNSLAGINMTFSFCTFSDFKMQLFC